MRKRTPVALVIVVERDIRRSRRQADIIEHFVLFVAGAIDMHITHAADARHIRFGDIEGSRDSHGGIDGVAALHQNAETCQRGERMTGRDHAATTRNGRAMNRAVRRKSHWTRTLHSCSFLRCENHTAVAV
jgi:hypothetical protein